MLIDTHCHLTFKDLRQQIDDVLARAAAAGVGRMITVGESVEDARDALALMADHSQIYLAAGIHPHRAAKTSPEQMAALADLHRGNWNETATNRRVVAIGETGLDFHYDFATPEQQESLFRFQLELAAEVGRPVVIHARKAEAQVCDILEDYPALAGHVVFHCYSEGPELTRRILDQGNFVSFTGVVTFKNAEMIRDSARLVPADRFMVETDAPFLTPEPIRKVRPCEPAHVELTARFLAKLRGESFDSLMAGTTANAQRFFGLSEELS